MDLNISTMIFACINVLLLIGSIVGILFVALHVAGRRSRSCPVCRKRIPVDSNICPYCGQQL